MKTACLIAEFNPFHRGHKYLIDRAKDLTGCDHLAVLMSGDFVQRGTPALISRETRAEIALRNGADIVFAYPSRYAASSAESFASFAVRLLDGTGIGSALVFGSECGEIGPLKNAAEILLEEAGLSRLQAKAVSGPDSASSVSVHLKEGHSYPKALSLSYPDLAPVLDGANNTLAIAYLKALITQKSPLIPCTLRREGPGHDSRALEEYASSSVIRSYILDSFREADRPGALPTELSETAAAGSPTREKVCRVLETALPPEGLDLLLAELYDCGPADESLLDELLISALFKLTSPRDLLSYDDVSPDLANRIFDNRYACRSFSDFAAFLKNKAMIRSRLNRVLLHIALDIKREDRATAPLYLHVLGCRRESLSLLSELSEKASLPVITGHSDAMKKLTGPALSLYLEEVRLTNLYEALRHKKKTGYLPCESQKLILV